MNSKNVGLPDAAIRTFLGVILLLAAASLQHRPLAALGVGFVGIVLLGTALFRHCPLYTVLGIDTCRPSGMQPR